MANPVNQPPQYIPNPLQPANPVRGPVPGGLGDAPTQLQSNKEEKKEEKGYIERAVHALRDFVVAVFDWLYKKLCCCFVKKEPVPPAAPQPPVQAPQSGPVNPPPLPP